MQFDELDNKIREAAENHHPAYDENAWAGMEKLLDKHLPQEKEGREGLSFSYSCSCCLEAAVYGCSAKSNRVATKDIAANKTTIRKSGENIPAPVSPDAGKSNMDSNKTK